MIDLVQPFGEALEALDRVRAEALFQQALADRPPIEVVEQLVVPALERIGRGWDEGSIALSQVYMSGRFCEELVDRALPPSDPERKHQPRSAIVVLDDYHLLGKRIVYSLLRAGGFELFDYGQMRAEALVERAIADRIEVLLISVLMLPSALRVREVRQGLAARGVPMRIAVGGAPFRFDPLLWREVGADGVGHSAAEALTLVQGWMASRKEDRA
jgi:methanogenic corrinoid protein MtbC1